MSGLLQLASELPHYFGTLARLYVYEQTAAVGICKWLTPIGSNLEAKRALSPQQILYSSSP
jgi:hypothetical protein